MIHDLISTVLKMYAKAQKQAREEKPKVKHSRLNKIADDAII